MPPTPTVNVQEATNNLDSALSRTCGNMSGYEDVRDAIRDLITAMTAPRVEPQAIQPQPLPVAREVTASATFVLEDGRHFIATQVLITGHGPSAKVELKDAVELREVRAKLEAAIAELEGVVSQVATDMRTRKLNFTYPHTQDAIQSMKELVSEWASRLSAAVEKPGVTPWSCDVCGKPGVKSMGPEGYCDEHRPVVSTAEQPAPIGPDDAKADSTYIGRFSVPKGWPANKPAANSPPAPVEAEQEAKDLVVEAARKWREVDRGTYEEVDAERELVAAVDSLPAGGGAGEGK